MDSCYWHSSGRKHWQTDITDWLCIRLDRAPDIRYVLLNEDTHHFFSDWYIFDVNQQPCEEHILDGPGPHHISIERFAGYILLVRARFLSYSRRPYQGDGGSHEVLCGGAFCENQQSIPLLVQVHGDPGALHPPEAPALAADALRSLMKVGEPIPPLVLQRGQGSIVFRLYNPVPFDTKVFLIEDQDISTSIMPGAEVLWSDLRSDLPWVPIEARSLAPASEKMVKKCIVALPVMFLSDQLAHVGKPLALSPLISGQKGWTTGEHVWVSWMWRGPRSWLKVHLSWDFYRDGQWANMRQEKTVFRQEYDRLNGIRLFEYDTTYEGWDVQISGVPLLCDEPVSGQQFAIAVCL